ncbi:MAG: hypothetical protein K1X35_08405 [Caulobacteraceae bacterium]|nr:hypothetical protein [Caulobacteraceae bacterium]
MAYREKIAWMSLVGMAATLGLYFVWVRVAGDETAPLPNLGMMGAYAVAAVAWAAFYLLGGLALRLKDPAEARARPDERDIAIDRRSTQVAYFVLMGLMLYVGGFKPFQSQGWEIVNAAIASVVIAEVVRCIVAVLSYRRSAA